jgi:hypothetical protein
MIPTMNIRLGVKYLEVLRQEFGEDRVALLAAYNAGPKKAGNGDAGDACLPRPFRFRNENICSTCFGDRTLDPAPPTSEGVFHV